MGCCSSVPRKAVSRSPRSGTRSRAGSRSSLRRSASRGCGLLRGMFVIGVVITFVGYILLQWQMVQTSREVMHSSIRYQQSNFYRTATSWFEQFYVGNFMRTLHVGNVTTRLGNFRAFGRLTIFDTKTSSAVMKPIIANTTLPTRTSTRRKRPIRLLTDPLSIDDGPRIISFGNKKSLDSGTGTGTDHLTISSIVQSNLSKAIMDSDKDFRHFVYITSSAFQSKDNDSMSLMLPVLETSSNLKETGSLLICDEHRLDSARISGSSADTSFLKSTCNHISLRNTMFSDQWICIPNIHRLLSKIQSTRLRLTMTLLSTSNHPRDFIRFVRRIDIPPGVHLTREACQVAHSDALVKGWGLEQPHTLICAAPKGKETTCARETRSKAKLNVDIVVCSVQNYSTISMLHAIFRAMPRSVRRRRVFYYQKNNFIHDEKQLRELEKNEANVLVGTIESLPDVGGCDHTYLHHIHTKYNDLGDVTLFLKDTIPVHHRFAQITNILAFASIVPPSLKVWCPRETSFEKLSFQLNDEKSEECSQFGKCSFNDAYLPSQTRPLGTWLTTHGVPSSLLNSDLTVSDQIRVCMGGTFAAGAAAIHKTPRGIYRDLKAQLSAGPSLEVEHYMERAWFSFFGSGSDPAIPKQQRVAIYSGSFCFKGILDPSQRTELLVKPAIRWTSRTRLESIDFIFYSNCESILAMARSAGWRAEYYEPQRVMPARNDIFAETMLKTAPHRFELLNNYDLTLYIAPGRSANIDALAYVVNFELTGTASIAMENSRIFDPANEHSILKAVRSWIGRPRVYLNRDKLMNYIRAERRRTSIMFRTFLLTDTILRRMTAEAEAFGELWFNSCRNASSSSEGIILHFVRQHAPGIITPITSTKLLESDERALPVSVTGLPDPEPRSWIFIATAESSPAFIIMTKRAVTSAHRNTNLRPICIFNGPQHAPLAKWLSSNGVEMIYHKPDWAWRIHEAMKNSENYEIAETFLAALMKIDISILLSADDVGPVVLYTDTDVLFCRNPTLADFGGQVPLFFTVGTEIDAVFSPSIPNSMNTGVMLLNLIGLRITYESFTEYVFSTNNVNRGLHFGHYGHGDQGAFTSYYEHLFDVISWPRFNWKPYWSMPAVLSDVSIVHYHGPKVGNYEMYFGAQNKNDEVEVENDKSINQLLQKCDDPRSGCRYWLNFAKSFDSEKLLKHSR